MCAGELAGGGPRPAKSTICLYKLNRNQYRKNRCRIFGCGFAAALAASIVVSIAVKSLKVRVNYYVETKKGSRASDCRAWVDLQKKPSCPRLSHLVRQIRVNHFGVCVIRANGLRVKQIFTYKRLTEFHDITSRN